MTRQATIRSLAKVNLDLRVLHRRTDGYHELATVFQTISLGDTIRLEVTPAPRTRITITANIDIPDNLMLRAAEAILRAGRRRASIHFELDKKIPMGGGLGGGSTNAASVLLSVPALAGFEVPQPKLEAIASTLGSDVTFFLFGGTALGLGRGTELLPLPELPKLHGLLVTPGVHVSTSAAYAALKRTGLDTAAASVPATVNQASRRLAWTMASEARTHLAKAAWPSQTANDFEKAVFRLYPQLGRIHRTLAKTGAKLVRMSGSGSTIFALYDNALAARRAAQNLPWQTRVFNTISRREYYRLWHSQLRKSTVGDQWPPQSRYAP